MNWAHEVGVRSGIDMKSCEKKDGLPGPRKVFGSLDAFREAVWLLGLRHRIGLGLVWLFFVG